MSAQPLYAPRPGPGVCVDCFALTPPGFARCLSCQRSERRLAAMVPIAYSVARESLHRDIRSYKRDADPSVGDAVERLAMLLGRFLPAHERCLAAAAQVERFDLVTTIPSQRVGAGARHPLERIVGTLVAATAERYRQLLRRTDAAVRPRRFDARRFLAAGPLAGASILLIDDMWTSGASAQSAAAALLSAGAGSVAAVVIARHLDPRRSRSALGLRALAAPLDFETCAHCAGKSRRPQ